MGLIEFFIIVYLQMVFMSNGIWYNKKYSILVIFKLNLTVHVLVLCFQINVIQPIWSCLGPFYTTNVIPLKDKNENNKLVMYQNCNIKMKHIHIFNNFRVSGVWLRLHSTSAGPYIYICVYIKYKAIRFIKILIKCRISC